MPILAVALVCMFILPGYVQAAEYVEKTIYLSIESSNQEDYDEVVNVADESSIKNPDTWHPAPQGIWLGSSTEESLFEFDVVATAKNTMKLASVVKFNRSQIMNGASEFVVRCPIATSNLVRLNLEIIRFTDEPIYDIDSKWFITEFENPDAVTMALFDIDLTDTSITSGSDAWTIDGRTYVYVRCPIYSDINYAFVWSSKLLQDQSFQVYFTGQDVANDNITSTRIFLYTEPLPDYEATYYHDFAADPGISFDLLQGLGNGVYASSFYMEAGDSISFQVTSPSNPAFGYQTIMVPFSTNSRTLDANVTVYNHTHSDPQYYWSDNDTWTEYILACSEDNMTGAAWVGTVLVTITVWEDVRVNWIFTDSPENSIISYYYNQAVLNISGVEHTVYSHLWYSYQESVAHIYRPSLDAADFPASFFPQPNQKATWYGTIIGVCLVVVGGAMIATGFLAPVGAIIAGVGTAMIISDVAMGGRLIDSGELSGFMENALDAINDALAGVGEFLRSVGEGLWDAITWLADAIIEFGQYLIGMLLIPIAMLIFFYPVQYQLKLWSYAWAMADGDIRGAGREANGIIRDSSKAVRTTIRMAGKVDRRVKVAHKAYSKWQKGRESARDDEGGDGQ